MPPLYPAGLSGAGLLLLRFSVAGSLVAISQPFDTMGDVGQILVLAGAAALGIGFSVRAIALVTLVIVPGELAGQTVSVLLGSLHTAIALALTFTGAGAYSADARLFGRRRINLDDDTSE